MLAMERSPFLPLPEGMVIGQVEIAEAQLTVEVISTQPCAHCPGCGSPSDHIHCQYQRTVHDVPCGGRKVVLRLRVRKFACLTASCSRRGGPRIRVKIDHKATCSLVQEERRLFPFVAGIDLRSS